MSQRITSLPTLLVPGLLALAAGIAPPPARAQQPSQAETAASDPELARRLERLRHELQVLEAKVALKRLEIEQVQAESRLRQLEGPRAGRTPPAEEPQCIFRPLGQKPKSQAELDAKTGAILEALDRPISMPFPNETPLEDVIKYIKSATVGPELPEGIPIYIDPVGLQAAEKTEQSPIRINLEGVPLERTLFLALRPLGLGYAVKDGLLSISDRDHLRELIAEPPVPRERPDPAATKSLAIRAAIAKVVVMPFPDKTPLEQVIKYIKTATVSPELPEGIPIHVDPTGLPDPARTMGTPVQLRNEGVPLERSLTLILDQVGLAFTVEDGLLKIAAKAAEGRKAEADKSR